jgi:site-specific DNA recombinase
MVLRRMGVSARISGQREYRGEVIAVGQWPAIITPAQTIRLRALLTDPARRTVRNPRRYLLTGLLRCGAGHPWAGGSRASGRDTSAPEPPGRPGCGRTYIVAEELDELIVEAVLYRLDTDELHQRLACLPLSGLRTP